MTGASLIASGRVPKMVRTFIADFGFTISDLSPCLGGFADFDRSVFRQEDHIGHPDFHS
jgi:hypothetical protein